MSSASRSGMSTALSTRSPASIHSNRTKLFNDLFCNYDGAAFSIRTADGWCWYSSQNDTPACTLEFKTPKALHTLLKNPTELTLGEAFIQGDLGVEGDIFSIFPVVDYIFKRPVSFRYRIVRTIARSSSKLEHWLHKGQPHSKARDRSSISYHYDQPVDFYQPWLGPTLAYSCAYFREPTDCLDQAQYNKLELICRKLKLNPGERFLDIGCGWGSLVLHAASEHGAEAYGITLSRQQAVIAAQRISQSKLGQHCAVELRDYRNGPDLPMRFDKLASVGMFEHVGRKNLSNYFSCVAQLLKPDGMFLNHGISRSAGSMPKRDSFIDRYVFPDGELVTLSHTLEVAESAGFEVRDVDNLREHYERTLRLWVENLQKNSQIVLRHVSEQTYRIWLLYMAGSAAAFRRGNLELYQVLFSRSRRPSKEHLTTREDWYKNWQSQSPGLHA